MVKIWLDAGHGDKDPGAVGNGLNEKDVNLKIVLALEWILNNHYDGAETRLTRRDDTFLTLTERTDAANDWGADFFLSVHANASGTADPEMRSNGFESYTYPDAGTRTRAVQNVLHSAIIDSLQGDLKDLGQKQADFHVLRESIMPAVLTENGFITNAGDAAKLKTEAVIDRLAWGHARGLAKFFGLTEKGEATQAPATDQPYNDITGHWAEADIKKVTRAGYMNGYDNGEFRPNDSISRAEVAAVISRMMEGGQAK